MGDVLIGTCSWKYDSWRGLVYPAEGDFDPLREYAKRFATVEVDQWFWSLFGEGRPVLPRAADAERYAAAVPPGFLFTVKAPNSITLTHPYRRGKEAPPPANPHFLSLGLYRDFLARLEPLRDRIGLVMLQFEYLNRQKMAARAGFLEKLAPFLDGRPDWPPLAIECRNPNYLDEGYFRFLRERGVHHVFCQGYTMPPAWEIERRCGDLLTDTAVVRLMGPDRQGIEARSRDRWDAIVEPRDGELAELAPMLRRLRKRLKRVYVNINNHFEGSAPLTAGKLRGLLA
jgi:uncharacterized protein YecE (DUF72 family)